MKITIEHEQINATTTSLVVAQRLLETIKELERTTIPLGKPDVITQFAKELPGELPRKDIFDTKDLSDIPAEVIKTKLPPFKPAWIETPIDLKKSKIVRYSNPCSTLKGHCGTKCWQTEIWIDTNGEISTCDCEWYDLDELKSTLDAYIKDYSKSVIEKHTKYHPACSKERLNDVAVLVKQGCNNKQIAERLGLSNASVSKYKTDCKNCGLL